MTTFTYDLHPVQRITADAVGDPGNRTFFLQARQGTKLVSLIMEKQQVAALATSILQLLEELEEQNPNLARARSQVNRLSLDMPLNPAFRVGQLGLGYDEEEDLVVIVAQSLATPETERELEPETDGDDYADDYPLAYAGGGGDDDDDGDEEDPAEKAEVSLARFYATRSQMRALGEHALQVVQAGRPDCPLCGRPIDPMGHFCPRTDGHAFPILI
ncbi:MAG: DUF3090 family protein [Caldilineaceae bacterium]|nr:DUF3090 family protein [Caldilineaceae bacterium]MBP8108992.1 DUF3090 family protein [Caldilineaceae bacterium]MBP8124137.1 DUF3090 family protein [Caldilineaceae bacterium]MBP9071290.1 DUF3090 family protein [Caldilineaceae bacterium]